MTTLLKIIFIFLIIYYIFKLFGRYIFPWLLRYFMKNVQKKYQQNAGNSTVNKKQKGEINIDHVPEGKKNKDNDDLGEYVDFEDIDK